jgi:hypothetical protein
LYTLKNKPLMDIALAGTLWKILHHHLLNGTIPDAMIGKIGIIAWLMRRYKRHAIAMKHRKVYRDTEIYCSSWIMDCNIDFWDGYGLVPHV